MAVSPGFPQGWVVSYYVDLPRDHEDVLYVLAMYGPQPLSAVREWSGVTGRALAGALNGLRLRGLAVRSTAGHWGATARGVERGSA